MIISVEAEKAFEKFSIYDKNSTKSEDRQNIPQHNKGNIYDKPTANIILNSEKLEAFFLRSGNKTRMPTLTTFIQQSFGSPSPSNQRRNKRNPN